jgi:hypothetical protein
LSNFSGWKPKNEREKAQSIYFYVEL